MQHDQARMRWREAYWDAVCVFLSDALSFGLALLEWMLVLKLGTHVCSMSVLVYGSEVCLHGLWRVVRFLLSFV